MTKSDVITTVLAEVSGQSKELVSKVFDTFKQNYGDQAFEDELPDSQANDLLAFLRQEREGIRAWLINNRLMEH